jgi:hypothetical protein
VSADLPLDRGQRVSRVLRPLRFESSRYRPLQQSPTKSGDEPKSERWYKFTRWGSGCSRQLFLALSLAALPWE